MTFPTLNLFNVKHNRFVFVANRSWQTSKTGKKSLFKVVGDQPHLSIGYEILSLIAIFAIYVTFLSKQAKWHVSMFSNGSVKIALNGNRQIFQIHKQIPNKVHTMSKTSSLNNQYSPINLQMQKVSVMMLHKDSVFLIKVPTKCSSATKICSAYSK